MFCALICAGVVGVGEAVGEGGCELSEADADGDDEPGPGIAPWTVSGSNTPDRTTANPPIAMIAIPTRTAIVRVGVMADETIGDSLNFGRYSTNTAATKRGPYPSPQQGIPVIIHNVSPTTVMDWPYFRHHVTILRLP